MDETRGHTDRKPRKLPFNNCTCLGIRAKFGFRNPFSFVVPLKLDFPKRIVGSKNQPNERDNLY
jgi:hypothetical protein